MQHLRPNLDDAAHRYNGDSGILCFNSTGLAVSVFSTCSSRQQMHVPKQNIGPWSAHRDESVAVRERITTQSVPTIPIAHQLTPAVSYLEDY
jgi:hypothetical protein